MAMPLRKPTLLPALVAMLASVYSPRSSSGRHQKTVKAEPSFQPRGKVLHHVDAMARRLSIDNAKFNLTAPGHKKRMVNLRKLRHRLRKELKAAAVKRAVTKAVAA